MEFLTNELVLIGIIALILVELLLLGLALSWTMKEIEKLHKRANLADVERAGNKVDNIKNFVVQGKFLAQHRVEINELKENEQGTLEDIVMLEKYLNVEQVDEDARYKKIKK